MRLHVCWNQKYCVPYPQDVLTTSAQGYLLSHANQLFIWGGVFSLLFLWFYSKIYAIYLSHPIWLSLFFCLLIINEIVYDYHVFTDVVQSLWYDFVYNWILTFSKSGSNLIPTCQSLIDIDRYDVLQLTCTIKANVVCWHCIIGCQNNLKSTISQNSTEHIWCPLVKSKSDL